MAAKTTYLETQLLNLVLRNIPFVPPTTVYVGLFTVAPTSGGGGTEVSDPSYARQPVVFGVPSGGVSANTGVITFPVATVAQGTIVAVAYFDALSGGNMLYQGAVTLSKTVGVGDDVSFAIGVLTIGEN